MAQLHITNGSFLHPQFELHPHSPSLDNTTFTYTQGEVHRPLSVEDHKQELSDVTLEESSSQVSVRHSKQY